MPCSGSGMSGQLGVAPLPGSAYVVPADTASSKQAGGAAASSSALLPCNASLCPHAAAMPDAALQLVTALTAPPSGSASPGPPQPQPQPAQPPPLVNRAPLLGEASNVWVLAAWQAADDLIRLDDYAGCVQDWTTDSSLRVVARGGRAGGRAGSGQWREVGGASLQVNANCLRAVYILALAGSWRTSWDSSTHLCCSRSVAPAVTTAPAAVAAVPPIAVVPVAARAWRR